MPRIAMMSLQLLVALQDALHAACDLVVLVADDERVELAARRVERIHRGVDAELRDLARQHHVVASRWAKVVAG